MHDARNVEGTGVLMITLEGDSKPFLRDIAALVLKELESVPEDIQKQVKQVRVLYHRYIGVQTIPVYKGWQGLIADMEEQRTWSE